jgi:phenylpyruvate tautomerase PptA (4-oxalocrotonate tautomerase family)
MPLYTISTQEGVLTGDAKKRLAVEITEYHCKLTGLTKPFVKIIFDTFRAGDGFVGGEVNPAVVLTVLIRIGRTADYKMEMARKLWAMVQEATGAQDTQILLAIQEAPASQAMEMGKIMPDL